MYLLQAKDLKKVFQNKTILEAVNLDINASEIVSLIGPNGSGKTTLLRLLLGLEACDTGSIRKQPGLRISYMPQSLSINPSLPLTVRRFLAMQSNNAERYEMQALLALIGIEHLLDSQLLSLSGGERQRVLLAYAVLPKPGLMLLDEPMQGVDIGGQEKLYSLITQLKEQLNCSILMVSHDLHFVMASTDRVLCLNGHICCQGAPEQVSQHPHFKNLFGDYSQIAIYQHHHNHQHLLNKKISWNARGDS